MPECGECADDACLSLRLLIRMILLPERRLSAANAHAANEVLTGSPGLGVREPSEVSHVFESALATSCHIGERRSCFCRGVPPQLAPKLDPANYNFTLASLIGM